MLLVAEGLAEFGLLPDPATSEADLVDLEASYELFLVADQEGMLGCGGLILADEETAKIRKMYVRADQRGQGLGRAILQRLIEEAKNRGRRRIVLETMAQMTDARAMYERFGFREIAGEAASPRCDRIYELMLG
jgi:GNAT superfamily N-acetyltransferase